MSDSLRGYFDDCVENIKVTVNAVDRFDRKDRLGRLLTYFTYRQLEHSMSLQKLDPNYDVMLISRAMIEGLFNLEWIMETPEERAAQYFDFSAIHNINLSEKGKISPDGFDLAEQESIAKQFLQSKSGKYHENFRNGVSYKSIADKNLDTGELYDCYRHLCDWAHWGPQSIRVFMGEPGLGQDKTGTLSPAQNEHPYRRPAILISLMCLISTEGMFCEHFKITPKIDRTKLAQYLEN